MNTNLIEKQRQFNYK